MFRIRLLYHGTAGIATRENRTVFTFDAIYVTISYHFGNFLSTRGANRAENGRGQLMEDLNQLRPEQESGAKKLLHLRLKHLSRMQAIGKTFVPVINVAGLV